MDGSGLERLNTAGDTPRGWRPALTARWLRHAMFTNRLAFEREMRRERRGLERRFKAYMKKDRQTRS